MEIRFHFLPMYYYYSICTKKCPQRLDRRSAAHLSPLLCGVEGSCPVSVGACSPLPPGSRGCTCPLSGGGAARAPKFLLFSLLCRLQRLGVLCTCLHSGEAVTDTVPVFVCGRPRETGTLMLQGQKQFGPRVDLSVVSSAFPFYLTEYLITTLSVLFSLFAFPQILQNQ